MQSTINNKNVIWESNRKQVGLIVLNFLFVAAIIWTRDKSSSFYFWGALFFFGGGGLFFLVRLLNPKNLFVKHNTKIGKEILVDQFRMEQESSGFFNFTDDGFSLEIHSGERFHKWSDIETVFGFKEDCYTTDEICIDIFTSNNATLRLTESTPGWYQFEKRLSANIPSIQQDWDGQVTVPAFETKLTLLFDRKGRTPKEAEAACYPK